MTPRPDTPRAAALLAEKGYKVAGFCGLSQYKGKKINPKVPK